MVIYDRETKQSVPVAWYVTWDVYVNSPKKGYGERIAGQSQKRYTDKNAAMKYFPGMLPGLLLLLASRPSAGSSFPAPFILHLALPVSH